MGAISFSSSGNGYRADYFAKSRMKCFRILIPRFELISWEAGNHIWWKFCPTCPSFSLFNIEIIKKFQQMRGEQCLHNTTWCLSLQTENWKQKIKLFPFCFVSCFEPLLEWFLCSSCFTTDVSLYLWSLLSEEMDSAAQFYFNFHFLKLCELHIMKS